MRRDGWRVTGAAAPVCCASWLSRLLCVPGVDDFLHRMEIALFAYGFNGDNSIGERRAVASDAAVQAGRWLSRRGTLALPLLLCCTNHVCAQLLCLCSEMAAAALLLLLAFTPLRFPLPAAMVNLCRDEVTNTLKHK